MGYDSRFHPLPDVQGRGPHHSAMALTTGAASWHQNVKPRDLNLFLEARPTGANGMRLRRVRKVCLGVKTRHLQGENEG